MDRALIRRSRIRVCHLALMVMVLGACDVDAVLTVQSAEDSSGVITLSLTLDDAALEAAGGMESLANATSSTAPWSISVDSVGGGGAAVTASRRFSHSEQAERIIHGLAGSGGPLDDVRLSVDEHVFTIASTVAGRVDRAAGAASRFDPQDRVLVAAIDRLGVPVQTVRDAIAGEGEGALTLAVMTDLPGNEGHNAPQVIRTVPRWEIPAGEAVQPGVSALG
jgi:hypothetical protein